ncbi:hypothetical protein BZA70DRAFT_278774 [Myxozyma melibiosi]|uniref:Secreted protein n=1 Tax=Myxozyma melibiosi TaxID=54550 RepID=A0ABR1F552_9ASCO
MFLLLLLSERGILVHSLLRVVARVGVSADLRFLLLRLLIRMRLGLRRRVAILRIEPAKVRLLSISCHRRSLSSLRHRH